MHLTSTHTSIISMSLRYLGIEHCLESCLLQSAAPLSAPVNLDKKMLEQETAVPFHGKLTGLSRNHWPTDVSF